MVQLCAAGYARESIDDAAMREAEEEIGVRIRELEKIECWFAKDRKTLNSLVFVEKP